jgi:ribosomal protein S18 acetylase RimI-like enzyme
MAGLLNSTTSLKIPVQDLHPTLDYAMRNPIRNAFIISNLTQLRKDCSLAMRGTADGEYAVASYYMDLPYFNINLMVNSVDDIRILLGKLTARHPELKHQPVYGLYDDATIQLLPECFKVEVRKSKELRMVLRSADIQELPVDNKKYRLKQLAFDDLIEISRLYSLVEGMAWTPKLLEFGPYFGTYYGDQLVSISGVQFSTKWVAEIGNIVTHFYHRKQNLAYACTRQVIEKMKESTDIIFLCVASDNEGAIMLYKKMGFEIFDELNLVKFYIE